MDDDVHGLVLSPFREVVEKGKEALENANDADLEPMRKAAEKLIKEGERALKKIEPLCKKNLDEYGPNFTDALKENDELATFRAELNDTLWEFDDYITAEEFDADKFAELQGLSRKAAPKIHDILMRMKLEHPHPEPEPSVTSAASGPSRSISTGGARRTPDIPVSRVATPLDDAPVAMPPYPAHEEEEAPVMGDRAGPDLGLEVPPLQITKKTPEPAIPEKRPVDSVRLDEVPPKPPVNPWEASIHTVVPPEVRNTAQHSEVTLPEQPLNVWIDNTVSPVSPLVGRVPTFPAPGVDGRLEDMSRGAEHDTQTPVIKTPGLGGGPGFLINGHTPGGGVVMVPNASGSSTGNRPPSVTLTPVDRPHDGHNFAGLARSPTESPILGFGSHRHSRASSTNESQPSVFDPRARDSLTSPVSDYRASELIHPEQSPSSASRDSFHSVSEQPSSPALVMANWSNPVPYPPPYPPSFHQDLPPVPGEDELPPSASQTIAPSDPEHAGIHIDDGLIPVDTTEPPPSHLQTPIREVDCSINLNSSFYQFRGFCEGAKDVIRGGLGVKKIKKAGIGGGNHVVAKCKHCLFELDWRLVEADLNNHDSASHQTAGIGFRLRFLSKSHLAARHVEDQLYACIFCIQLGKTMEESDATVFFTQKQLFTHLARHPRPLPKVPGVTIIEGPTVPPQLQNNFDLHFCNPPVSSVMSNIAREISAMPSAVATDTFRASHGVLKAPPGNRGERVLQFAAGARIVGIEFPEHYNGEWAIGWADHMRAAFPLDCVRLEAPAKSDVRMQPNSNLRAVARWGRKPKDKDKEMVDWLKFDKGDIINSIGYPYTEHWCWSGYNAKGKWGVFPQAYIEPNTLMEAPGSDRASLLSQESKSGVFSRISIRKNKQSGSGGPGNDTVNGHTQRPAIF